MKKQMKKPVIAALLLISMLLSAVACGSDANNGNDTTAGGDTSAAGEETTAEPTPLQGLEKKDYGGRTFTILDANDNTATSQNIPGDEETGEVVNDGLIQRANYVEANLGVKLEFLQRSNDEGIEMVRTSVLADEHSVDMMTGRLMNGMTTLALSECLTDINSLDGLSLNESWW